MVKVHVIGARNLTAADANTFSEDSSDPYAVLFVSDEGKSQQTKTLEETLSPVWREWLEFKEVTLTGGPIVKTVKSNKTGMEPKRPYQWGPLGGYY